MDRALVAGLRQRGIDVVTVQDQGMRHRKDAEQLAFATAAGRVLYSANVGDFARLHGQILAREEHHSGIILLPEQRYSVGEQLRRMLILLHARSAGEMVDKLEFLSNWR